MANNSGNNGSNKNNLPLNRNGFESNRFVNRSRNPLKKDGNILRKANGTPIGQNNNRNSFIPNSYENEEDVEEKSKTQELEEKVASKATSSVIQAASGGAIPKPVADAISNKVAGPLVEAARFRRRVYLIMACVPLLIVFLVFTSFTGSSEDSETKKQQYFTSSMTDEELYKYLEQQGFCKKNDCSSSKAAFFYKSLKNGISDVSKDDRIYVVNLALAMMGYQRTDKQLFATSSDEVTSVLNKLKELNIGKNTDLDNNSDLKEYIIGADGYISTYRTDVTGNQAKIYAAIIKDAKEKNKTSSYYKTDDTNISGGSSLIYSNCKSVTVNDASRGTFSLDLEEYVAGVVQSELGGGNLESRKAQAVLARSFVLNATNNCEKSINNSENQQTYRDAGDAGREAANATAGEVIQYEGKYFTTSYASYPRNGFNSDGSGFSDPRYKPCYVSCSGGNCTTTLYRQPNMEAFEFTMPNSTEWNGLSLDNQAGHCYGLSQIGAMYYGANGKNYQEILKIFYSDGVEINKLSTVSADGLVMSSDGKFAMRLERPQRNNTFYYTSDQSAGAAGTLEGECAWYATGRAKEILATTNSSKTWTYNGNGGTYCDAADSNKFTKVYDYTKPKAGAIVSWSNGSYGHVAVIESVNSNGTVDISETAVSKGSLGQNYIWNIDGSASARKRNCEGNGSGCFWVSKNVPLSEVQTRWGNYRFNCYVYLVD